MTMTRQPLTDVERQCLADSFAFLSLAIAGKCPDRVFELIDRLTMLLALPPPRRWATLTQSWQPPRRTNRMSDRISEDEIGIVLAFIDALSCIYDSRATHQVMEVTIKLKQLFHSLAVDDCKTLWKEFDEDEKICHSFERMR